MKGIRKSGKVLLIGLNIVVMVLMIFQMFSVSDAATRDENIQKIKDFLRNEAVANSSIKMGKSPEKIISQLDSLSDWQIEKLATHANIQVGGAIEDTGVSDFWKTYGLLVVIAILAPVLLFAVLKV